MKLNLKTGPHARSVAERQWLWNTLTAREIEVAYLVAEGKRNREIADQLCLSAYTVETHLKHIYSKLQVHSRTQLANRVREVTDSTHRPIQETDG